LFVVVVVLLSDIIKNFRKKKSEKNEFGKRNLQRHSNVRRERWNIISFTLFIDSLCDIIKKTESIKGKDYEANFSLFWFIKQLQQLLLLLPPPSSSSKQRQPTPVRKI